jgi:hypothetical protein
MDALLVGLRAAQLAAMDAAELVAELLALSNIGDSYDEQARCCARLCKASPLPTGAAATNAARAVLAALSRGAQHAPLQIAGCEALRTLLQAEPGLSTTVGASGLTAVLAALRAPGPHAPAGRSLRHAGGADLG